MENKNYKQVNTTKLTEKDKVLLVGLIFLIIIAIIVFFNFDKSKIAEVNEGEVKLGPSSSETKKELALWNKNFHKENTLTYVEGKMISLKQQMISKGYLKAADALQKASTSYDNSEMNEALASIGATTGELLKLNITFLFPGSRNLAQNHIKIAARKKLITKGEKVYLLKIKEITDINCLPSSLGNNVQVEQDLHLGLKIIENLI